MRSIYKKGISILFGILITVSLVYINVGSARAASAITGLTDSVWYDADGNGAFDTGEGIDDIDVYLDNSGIIGATTAAGGSFTDVFAAVNPQLDWDGDHYLTFKADGFRTVTYNVSNLAGATALAAGSVQMILLDSIYGKALGNDGRPVAGITIEALVYGTSTVADDVVGGTAQTVTDQYGNFVIKGLPAATYDIRATKGEYITQLITGVKVIYGQTTENVNFTMYPNYGSITGHVTDGAIPLQGAIVSIPGLGLSAVTNSSGQFSITGIMPGSYTIICEKDGYKIGVLYYDDSSSSFASNPANYSPFVQPGPSVTPTSVDFNLDPEPITPVNGYISGIVTDQSGRQIECAYVTIPGLPMAVCTDKGGFFIFEEVPNGEYDVLAQDPNPNTEYLEHKSAKLRVEVVPGERSGADYVLLENPGFIIGQIFDKDAMPVYGASVSIPNSTISSLTDLYGWYALEGVKVQRYTVYDYASETISYHVANVVVKATSSDYYSSTLVVEPMPANSSYDDTYNIILVRKTGVIKGQVYEIGTGHPIEDARVRVYGRETLTDSSGIFEFVQVPVGSYTVVAGEGPEQNYVESDYDLVTKKNIIVGPGTQTMLSFYLPDATLSLYGYISGVIYEDIDGSASFNEGEGIPGLTVEIPGYPTVITDDYGFYIAWADAGSHNQVVYGGDYEWYSSTETFTSNVETPGVDIELSRQTGELVGRVTEGGDPVESANLWVPQYENDWSEGSSSVIEVNSDVYGNYAFANDSYDYSLEKGRHLLIVQRWDSSIMSFEFDFSFVTIASTVNKDISLTRETGRVEGFVWWDTTVNGSYDAGEAMLPDANVSLSKVHSTTSDSTGYYTILDVPVTLDRDTTHPTPAYEINRYTGIAYLTGYNAETFVSAPIAADAAIYDHTSTSPVTYTDCNNIEVFEDVDLSAVTQNIVYPLDKSSPLPVNGSVSGYVNLGLNLIDSEAEVWIESTNKNTWSDIEGFWIILDVTPGNYAIQAGKPNYVSQIHSNVPIIEGFENTNIDYSLDKDGFIYGTVYEDIDHNGSLDLTDVPVQGAIVTIGNLQAYTDSNGEYIIPNVYANAPYNGYTVTATKLNYNLVAEYDVEVFHADPTGTLIEFLLEKDEGFIIGKVVDQANMKGIPSLDVYAMDDLLVDNTETAATDDAGYYVITANRGTYTLQAPKEPNATGYVTKEIYDVSLAGYSIVRENFVLWDETTMPDNNVFGIVYRDDDVSTTYDDGEEIGGVIVSIPGLEMSVISASELTDPDGTPGNGDEYNFIFMDVPDNGGYSYTVTAKLAIPGTSPTQYIMEYITAVVPGTQQEIGLEWPPVMPYDSWIEGIVFWDENDNGLIDENERLPDINVFIPGSSPTNQPGTSFLAGVTDSTGYYIINKVPSRMNDVPVICTVLAQEPSTTADYEVGIQRNLPVQSGRGEWIDFPLDRTTSYTSAYIFGEVYFDENTNGAYDVDDSPATEGIMGATLDANGYSTSTDSFGFYIFNGLTANQTYLVEVNANGYETHSEYEMAALGYNGNIDFPMTKLANSISGFVFEDVNDNGIKDAVDKVITAKIVAVKDGGGTYEAYTDVTGFYLLSNLPIGDYDMECVQLVGGGELPEYQDWTYLDNPVTITAGNAATVDIPMSRYYVDVDGTVTDADTTNPIVNVTVAWYSPDDFTTPRYIAMTDLSGQWSTSANSDPDDDWNHTDLDGDEIVDPNEVGAPVGTWYVVFSASGYDTKSKWIVLDWNDVPGPITVDIELSETSGGTIDGTVTNASTAAPIENATIRATNQTTSDIYATLSLADGSYELIVPEGTYDIVCTKLGFADETANNVIVLQSTTTTQDFDMTPTGGFADITVNVEDDVANPLDDVLVTVWYQDPSTDLFTLIVDGTTTAGSVTFTDVPVAADGTYYVCASDNDNDRVMETEEVELEDGVPETVNFTLLDGTSETISLNGTTSQWYLLSLPVLVRDDTFWPALLYASGIDETGWDMIASWDNATDSYDYYDTNLSHATGFWLVRDPALTYDPGFWLHMEAGNYDLKVVGEEATTRVLNLPGGHWTLMGYALLDDGNPIATAIAQNPADSINLMWTYDIPPTAAHLYDPRGRFVPNGFEELELWHAYWIFVDVNCTLTIT